jgi:hypothetical protein
MKRVCFVAMLVSRSHRCGGAGGAGQRRRVDAAGHGARSDRGGAGHRAGHDRRSRGVEQTAAVDDRGVAVFENLNPGTYQVKAAAESFRPIATPFNVRRGENRTTLRLALATIEQTVVVQDQSAADRRDNGFTQTLTQDQIDSLPDDPDEMARS